MTTQVYAAFLRGVSPMNAKMPELARAFTRAGFGDVRTLLSSGNVVFGAPTAPIAVLERTAQAAMQKYLGKAFVAFVRPINALRKLLTSDPYAEFALAPGSKRVVTFLHAKPKLKLDLPIEREGARILLVRGTEVFSAYQRGPRTPVFMQLIDKAFGKQQTTRTWETVAKTVQAGGD